MKKDDEAKLMYAAADMMLLPGLLGALVIAGGVLFGLAIFFVAT